MERILTGDLGSIKISALANEETPNDKSSFFKRGKMAVNYSNEI